MSSLAVVICAYCNERRHQLDDAIGSVLNQKRRPEQVVVVIDHNDALLRDVARAFADIDVIANCAARGLSGARNTGIRVARTDVIAFLDDDAVAEPDWLAHLAAHYTDPSVIGVGGKVLPLWQSGRPRWFPEEFQWVVGCSYRGQPETLHAVRNPIGCNMSFRRAVFHAVGGFSEGIGRLGQDAAGCEETELSIRANRQLPNALILYDPSAVVHHRVDSGRICWRYFRKRCIAEGRSKHAIARRIGAGKALAAEHAYVTRTLPGGIVRGVIDVIFRFDPWGLMRAAGIIAGLAFATVGYTYATATRAGRRP